MVIEARQTQQPAHHVGLKGFASSPALARGHDQALWLAYLDFDGEGERVRLIRTVGPGSAGGVGGEWTAPVDLCERGAVFPPAIAVAGSETWVFWVARDPAPGPAEQATFTLWGRPLTNGGKAGAATLLAGGLPAGGRPYQPAACSRSLDGVSELWLAYEGWGMAPAGAGTAGTAGAQPVTLCLRRYRDGVWSDRIDVPVPSEWRASGRVPRMYDVSVTADGSGTVHLVWWSPNGGEAWEPAGTRAGTTADDLRTLSPAARLGNDDGSSTGSDVWYARYDPLGSGDAGRWCEPERLNRTAGWHLHPTASTGDDGRVWVTWSAITGRECYPELTSDIPYVQTARARAKRAPWFREARPVVRLWQPASSSWHMLAVSGNSSVAGASDEPGVVEHAGHSLFPRVVCTDGGAVALVTRRYGVPQNAEMNTGERRGRLRAFETALLWLGDGGWGEPEVLHAPELGGILAPPAAVAVAGDQVLVAWQGDLGTRNAQSEVCVAVRKGSTDHTPWLPLHQVEWGDGGGPAALLRSTTPAGVGQAEGEVDGRREPFPKLFFGNIHMHTEQSFCRRQTSLLLDFNYRWAQDCMGQDFAVLTDHAETKSAYEWWLNRKTAAFFTTPSFAALLGYEWTTPYNGETGEGHGHLDVYFRGDPPRFWPANAVESSTGEGLWELLRKGEVEGYPAFTVSHHPSVSVFRRNWSRWGGDAYEPVVEIHQDRRGSFERRGGAGGGVLPAEQYVEGHAVRDALARGYRLGFVSGGDHMGISMTGVFAAALTREAIFDAIRTRRCYAVTGAKIGVTFEGEIEGRRVQMGDIVHIADTGAALRVGIRVTAPSPLRRIVLVQDGKDVVEHEASGAQGALSATLNVRPGGYCYTRVELADGELAWTSPAFFVET
jgi:hypothetical protein